MSAENTGVQKAISRRELLAMVSPFGKITLAGECTGCGLCVPECPTGALNIETGAENRFTLIFRQQRCTACNGCVAICPEKCLNLERSLTPAPAETPRAVLFENGIARCAGCGKQDGRNQRVQMHGVPSCEIHRLTHPTVLSQTAIPSKFPPPCSVMPVSDYIAAGVFATDAAPCGR